ncbi:MAG TPA: hypothetical protein VJ732_14655, partial [Bryobacteraceae bacterium]|nr:hypothetical protein [Bryobacteraceae bacterium]
MACLYCGKEIGPIRLIRDSEFCSPKHRKEYKERLRKVLIQVGEPETAAHGMAPFADALRPLAGSRAPKAAPLDFSASEHLFHSRISWNIAIPPVLGQEFAPIRRAGAEIPPRSTRRDFRTEPYEYFGEQAAEKLTLPAVKLAAALPQPGAPAALASPETASTAALPVPHGSWIARTTLLRIPDRLPGVKGISSAADHPLCGPLGLDYRVARITPRAATLASPLSAPAVSEPVLPTLFPAVAECAEMADEATPLVPTGACANFQPGPAPEAAAREVHSHLAATGPAFFEQRLPIIPTAALCARPEPALIALPVPSAEPAEIAARSRDLLKPATGKLESVVPASSPEIPSAQMAPGAERWTAVPHVEPVERSVSARCASPAPFAAPPLQIQPLAVALAQ